MKIKSLRKRNLTIYKTDPSGQYRRISIGKVIFFLLLFYLAFAVGQWVYLSTCYVTGMGYVEAESAFVQSLIVARITKIDCQALDPVVKGQAIVKLNASQIQAEADLETQRRAIESQRFNPGVKNPSDSISYQQKLIDLENNVKKLAQRVKTARTEQAHYQSEYDRYMRLVQNNVATVDDLEKIDEKLQAAKRNASSAAAEYELERSRLQQYKENITPVAIQPPIEVPLSLYHNYWQTLLNESVLYAPLSGVVAEVFKHDGEVVKVGESVLKIYDPSKKCIRTQFAGRDRPYIKEGTVVSVEFESQRKTSGIIRQVFPSAHPMRDEYRKTYVPPENFVLADIEVLDEDIAPEIILTKATVFVRKPNLLSMLLDAWYLGVKPAPR
ncbi:MAG TPA: HlyD family efflux transporter periplasmic adaptor subunit [bacterium]|nr:HlyD family efflux transporter periplasmic adaptor subunit [Candidatus Omnitrophota bacterium]HOJ62495.1 HlyD family efflux transporter periplasmic adaptor subunit [bacterium]HXK94981.1 HlyD family efflux transporter periplasmic adaptor subunit [bacterium]